MKLVSALRHIFLPHSSNNHRAKILHHSSLILVIGALFVYQLGVNFFSSEGQVLGYASQISVEEVIRLTNVKRAEAGVAPVTLNSTLSQAAASKGAHMLQLDYWAHVAPDGTQPWKFFGDVNYKYRYAGENLARDFSSAQATVDAWMNSPTHRENMLSAKYKDIGIGVVEGDLGGKDTTLVVQLFGTKQGDTPPQVAQVQTQATQTIAPIATIIPAVARAPIVPTVAPSSTPVVTLAQNSTQQVLVSPFISTKGVSLLVIIVLLVVLAIDLIVISRKRVQRISGRSWAHISFFAMLLIIVIIMQAGKIL
jgi:hypothetical protein